MNKLTIGYLEDLIKSLKSSYPINYRNFTVMIDVDEASERCFIEELKDDVKFIYDWNSYYDPNVIKNPKNIFDLPGKIILSSDKCTTSYDEYIAHVMQKSNTDKFIIKFLLSALEEVKEFYINRHMLYTDQVTDVNVYRFNNIYVNRSTKEDPFEHGQFQQTMLDVAAAYSNEAIKKKMLRSEYCDDE